MLLSQGAVDPEVKSVLCLESEQETEQLRTWGLRSQHPKPFLSLSLPLSWQLPLLSIQEITEQSLWLPPSMDFMRLYPWGVSPPSPLGKLLPLTLDIRTHCGQKLA